jgi:hypothetical protein
VTCGARPLVMGIKPRRWECSKQRDSRQLAPNGNKNTLGQTPGERTEGEGAYDSLVAHIGNGIKYSYRLFSKYDSPLWSLSVETAGDSSFSKS